MKKGVLFCATLILITLSTIMFNISLNNKKDQPKILLFNIEAMAENEDVVVRVDCWGSGDKYCPIDRKSIYKEIKEVQ